MKRLTTLATMMACGALTTQAWGASCKPQTLVWQQTLVSAEIGVTASVGRHGTVNAVELQIQKRKDAAAAVVESVARTAAGTPFYFDFQQGEPVAFVVSEVIAGGKPGVVLSAAVADPELPKLREALTSREITGVRVAQEGGGIAQVVKEKDAKKMQEKFACFFAALESSGVIVSAAPVTVVAPGRYFKKDKPEDYFDVVADGTVSLQQGTKTYAGTYEIQGEEITARMQGFPTIKLKLAGETIVDPTGKIWARQAAE
jgi:hypothetical protein